VFQLHKMPIKIDPEMREYIKNSFSELRVCTTCDGPILLPTRIKPPKMTDVVLDVEGRTFYISAVQAPMIKSINMSMLPKCAFQKKR